MTQLQLVELPLSVESADIVKALEDMLEMARKGELRAIAVAGVRRDYNGVTAIHVEQSYGTTLVGALRFLENRLVREME